MEEGGRRLGVADLDKGSGEFQMWKRIVGV